MEVETAKRKREPGGELGEKPGKKEVERYPGSWVFEGKGVGEEDRRAASNVTGMGLLGLTRKPSNGSGTRGTYEESGRERRSLPGNARGRSGTHGDTPNRLRNARGHMKAA